MYIIHGPSSRDAHERSYQAPFTRKPYCSNGTFNGMFMEPLTTIPVDALVVIFRAVREPLCLEEK